MPLVPHNPAPVTKIRFDNGNTVTIRDGFVQASPPELTAIIDTLAATLPGYGSVPFVLDEDFNIAEGLIRIGSKSGVVSIHLTFGLQDRAKALWQNRQILA